MKHWKTIALALLFPLAGCEKATVTTCEQFIRGGLSAPTTYKRIGIKESSRTATNEELLALGKDPRMIAFSKRYSIPAGGLHSVVIEYDAQNSFGVPLRSKQICLFEGEKPVQAMLDTGLSKAERKRDGTCCLY